MGRLAAWDKQGRYDDYFGALDSAGLLRFSAERTTLKKQQLESQRASVGRILDGAIDFLSNVVPSMVAPSLLEGAACGRHVPGMWQACARGFSRC